MATPATNKQTPDNSILDHFDKQIYLGNTYSVTQAFTVGTSETPLLYLSNAYSAPTSQGVALFQNLIKVVENTASKSVILNIYLNPTVAAKAVQTVTTRADSSGNLNDTYWTFYLPSGAGFYVWYNINSAGTDPAVVGLTGIEVSAATGATNATIASDTVTAINAATSGVVASVAVSGHVITLTMTAIGPVTPAADSTAAATSFTFAVTSSQGTAALTPVNMRAAYPDNSIATFTVNPTATSNGTLVDSISAAAQSVAQSTLLRILDSGESILITSIASASSTSINVILQEYEL